MSDVEVRKLERVKDQSDHDMVAWLTARIRRGDMTKLKCCDTGTATIAELFRAGYELSFVDKNPGDPTGVVDVGVGIQALSVVSKDEAGKWSASWAQLPEAAVCPRCKGTTKLSLERALAVAATLGNKPAREIVGYPHKRTTFADVTHVLFTSGHEVMVRASIAMANVVLAQKFPEEGSRLDGNVVQGSRGLLHEHADWIGHTQAIEAAEKWLECQCVEHEEQAEAAHIYQPTWAALPYGAIHQASHWPKMVAAVAKTATTRALKEAVARALIPELLK